MKIEPYKKDRRKILICFKETGINLTKIIKKFLKDNAIRKINKSGSEEVKIIYGAIDSLKNITTGLKGDY